ncbi:MAG TPA: hypothetical protein VNW15_01995 [Rhizomicrobium sp.]|nr:hypothetical protein [Rhizomicrobium sp.]
MKDAILRFESFAIARVSPKREAAGLKPHGYPQSDRAEKSVRAAGQHKGGNHENNQPGACQTILYPLRLDAHHRDLPLFLYVLVMFQPGNKNKK